MAREKKAAAVPVEEPVVEVPRGRGRPKGAIKSVKNDRDKISRAKAIRLQCTECMGFQPFLIKDCPSECCPLWPFRIGRGQQHTDATLLKGHYAKSQK